MDLSGIAGLGPKRIAALESADIRSIPDLLYNIPRNWLDRTRLNRIAECTADQRVVLVGTIIRAGVLRGRRSRFSATLRDETGTIELLFFSGVPSWSKRLEIGSRWVAMGKVSAFRSLQMVHPELQPMDEEENFAGGIVPIYSINEEMRKLRMENRFFIKLYAQVFKQPNLHLPKGAPLELTEFLGLRPIVDNLRRLHQPASFGEAMQGKRQLKILELLPFCLRMAKRRRLLQSRGKERRLDLGLVLRTRSELPFELTAGQSASLERILAGLGGKSQFHALLQGDVGSGKTVVALLAMLGVCGAGEQSALMVPTDILARQHYQSLKPWFDAAGLRLGLLLGATGSAERRTLLGELNMGLIHAVIGTHALFSQDVQFASLGFAIIDEQHRFGVQQREALLAKGKAPDLLVMSATPIPRSLAMTFYGDLEAIVLHEKPPGRKPVKTRLVDPAKRDDMKAFVLKESLAGNRCYWVVSRVEIADEGESLSVDEVREELQSYHPGWKVGIVHGQMDEALRDAELSKFASGETHVIVCTTVVEVGVNVPAANLMVIDQPERFGLAQLHQLRGRVGRGTDQAWCFLNCAQNNTARQRLEGFAATEDGFEIAEMDMRERGAGNLEGKEQSGSWVFRWFDWIEDQNLIEKTLATADELLDNRPGFAPDVIQKIQDWYNLLPPATHEDGVH